MLVMLASAKANSERVYAGQQSPMEDAEADI